MPSSFKAIAIAHIKQDQLLRHEREYQESLKMDPIESATHAKPGAAPRTALRGHYEQWPDWKMKILKERYHDTTTPRLAIMIRTTARRISNKAYELGLKKTKEHLRANGLKGGRNDTA